MWLLLMVCDHGEICYWNHAQAIFDLNLLKQKKIKLFCIHFVCENGSTGSEF